MMDGWSRNVFNQVRFCDCAMAIFLGPSCESQVWFILGTVKSFRSKYFSEVQVVSSAIV